MAPEKESGIHIIGGGTVNHIRSHFALTAVAYGGTAKKIHALLEQTGVSSHLHLTKMACAGESKIETNKDVAALTQRIIADAASTAVVFNAAVTDFEAQIGAVPSGKYATRLRSRDAAQEAIVLTPSDKIVPTIKENRPDIFVVAFKTTTHGTLEDQIERGRGLVTYAKADLVLANDTGTRRNLLLDKDGQVILDTQDRAVVLQAVAEQIIHDGLRRRDPSPV